MITADCGGSNGYRVREWKWHLAQLAAETGLEITVCHYPPGTSKWNKIEHRLFSFISINWRGRPLTDIRTIFELIAATTTTTGLTVQAAYDPEWHAKGVKISDAELATIPITAHDWHGESNYTIAPPHKPRKLSRGGPLPLCWYMDGTYFARLGGQAAEGFSSAC